MHLRITLIITFCLAQFVGQCQSPADWWYFGDSAGIHFTPSGPVADTNGVLSTNEGCASVSSSNGDLLFYTDGTWVFNAQHDTMPDGDSLFGNGSSTQSAVIVPYPGNPYKYYIFTVRGCTGGSPNGLSGQYFSYSIVDMTLESGLGNVVVAQKNIILFDSAAEKCTAMLHHNGNDIWVIGHEEVTNRFHAFHIGQSGIIDTVTSNVGPIENYCIGYMLASHKGDKIAMALYSSDSVLVFPFDQFTGVISSPFSLFSPSNTYGIHFSPNDSILYVSCNSSTGLYQYNLYAPNVQASEFQVSSGAAALAIAEGPDKKLYVASGFKEYIAQINDPNVYGVGCNYIDSAIFLGGRICRLGLPNNVAAELFLIAEFQSSGRCYLDTTYFALDTAGVDSVSWNFGDPASGVLNTSAQFNPAHYFSDTGNFTVTVIPTLIH